MRLRLEWNGDDEEIRSRLDFAQNRLYVARAMIPSGYETYFRESAQYVNAHTSTAIEGNTLGDEQAMRVLAEGADPGDPMQVEKVNLDEAYKAMATLTADKTTKVDEGIIRTVNSMVLKGLPDAQARNRGRYRVGPSLVVDASTREIRYRPPRPQDVPELMQGLVEDIQRWARDESGAVAAAMAHFGLVSIHPFDDGNGRTARLIADMILDLTDWSAEAMVSVSEVIHSRLTEYYRVLREVQGEEFKEEVDLTGFVRFHSDVLAQAAANLEEKSIRFSRRRDQLAKSARALNERQVTGLMFMIDIGQVSSSDYARLTRSSQATALSDLNTLLRVGVVLRDGAGKNTRYRISPSILNDEGAPEKS
jgi:Fic family protein